MTVRVGLIIGGGLVVIVAAAGLVMTTIEQVTDRHRSLVLAAAGGVPRMVLGQSLILGTAFPAALALVVADAVGLAIPLAMQALLTTPLHVSIAGLLGFTVVRLALVVAVTASALPAMYRLTKPETLRTE